MKMKKLFIVAPALAVLFTLAGCGGVDVVDYNDKLVDLADKCFTAEGLMRDAMDQENYGSAKTLYDTTVETCQASQADTAAMEPYDDDASLRDAVDALLQAELAYLGKFGETLPYREYDEFTDEQETAYNALEAELETIEEAINAASESLGDIQEAFAAKHGYELEE
jgi:uncharacterized damage-inducible protein DinB